MYREALSSNQATQDFIGELCLKFHQGIRQQTIQISALYSLFASSFQKERAAISSHWILLRCNLIKNEMIIGILVTGFS